MDVTKAMSAHVQNAMHFCYFRAIYIKSVKIAHKSQSALLLICIIVTGGQVYWEVHAWHWRTSRINAYQISYILGQTAAPSHWMEQDSFTPRSTNLTFLRSFQLSLAKENRVKYP